MMSESTSKGEKVRAPFVSAAEQSLLMELYDKFKDTIRNKENTAALNKAREMAWQKIVDRLNA